MKKMILAIAAMAIMGISASAAEVTGSILSTDIGTLIDGAPCKTYNVDGRTFVIAEDLRGYGFDVVYDDSIRRLTITQNPYSERTILSKEEINITKDSITVGQWLGDMFATDITVYLGDEQIEAYAIDGQMVIPVRALEKCAYVEFDSSDKLVYVNGLQHYLTTRYKAGNPNVTYEANEKEVRTYYEHWQNGNKKIEIPGVSHSEYTISKETTASYCENGNISAYFGNPYVVSGNTVYRIAATYKTEKYTIRDSHGNLFYDINIAGNESQYMRNNAKILRINSYHLNLYGLEVEEEKDYYSYWPSESGLAENKLNFVKVIDSSNRFFITDTGMMYTLEDNSSLSLVRYNIVDAYKDFYLSADGKLYAPSTHAFTNEINSIFDVCIAENVKKFCFDNAKIILRTDGQLYSLDNQYQPYQKLADRISDFAINKSILATVNDKSELYIAYISEYQNAQLHNSEKVSTVVDTDVCSIVTDENWFYYLKADGRLYKYDLTTWKRDLIRTGIKKLCKNNLCITNDDTLIDLDLDYIGGTVIATDVKDAYSVDKTSILFLKNNNNIFNCTFGYMSFEPIITPVFLSK